MESMLSLSSLRIISESLPLGSGIELARPLPEVSVSLCVTLNKQVTHEMIFVGVITQYMIQMTFRLDVQHDVSIPCEIKACRVESFSWIFDIFKVISAVSCFMITHSLACNRVSS